MDDVDPIEPARDKADAPAGRAAGERGRSAERPSDIPRRGWWDIVLRVYRGVGDDRILMNAAGVTFYALLALFPAIAAVVSIYGLFADPSTIAKELNAASGLMPGGAISVVRDQLTRLTSGGHGALSIGFAIGLLASLWSANGGVKGLFDALNVVYGEKETRGFLRLNATTLLFTIAMLGFGIVAIVCVVAAPLALQHLPGFIGTVIAIARWPLIAALVAVALACTYRYGPNRREPRWRWISWGSVVAALLWLGLSGLFSYYAANFGTFNKTYGSLGAIVGCMIWIWLSATLVLLGGKLNAEIEHQTGRDSTAGGDKPLGRRGARMADTIGAPQH